MYLGLAWIFRYSGEQDKETEMMQRAADLYDQSLMTERFPQNGMSDDTAVYLIGAIYYRLKDYEKATQYLSRLIGDQSLRDRDVQLYKRARDLWQSVREDQGEAKDGLRSLEDGGEQIRDPDLDLAIIHKGTPPTLIVVFVLRSQNNKACKA